MRSRVLAIVIAVVVPLAALGVVISRGGSSTHKPARLPILAAGATRGNAAMGLAQADAMLYPYGGIVYKAGPDLPTLNGSARAYKILADTDVGRLKDALGIRVGKPDANGTFADGDRQLNIAANGSWGYSAQSSGVVSSGTAVACPANADCPAPVTTVPQHPADLPSQDEAGRIALQLLEQVGIDTRNVKVTVDDYLNVWSVRVDPVVDGVPTEGFATTTAVGPHGVIEYANGTLGRPVAADEYPLIGTSGAIERLNNGEGFIGPRPMMAEPAIASDAGSGAMSGGAPDRMPPVTDTIPTPPPPQEITLVGAEHILMFAPSYDGRESWLVPGYRFTTSEGVGPSVLAIDDSFLAPPPDQIPSGKGSVDPSGPVTIEPVPASDRPAKEPSTGG
jgi:hypothetical protein